MTVFDIPALSEKRRQILQAKHDATAYATQGIREFSAAARQIGTPVWTPPDFIAQNLRREGFASGYLVLRNSSVSSDWIQTVLFGAIVEANGNHRLKHQRASAEDLGAWIAGMCGYDLDTVKRVFHEALVDVPLSTQET